MTSSVSVCVQVQVFITISYLVAGELVLDGVLGMSEPVEEMLPLPVGTEKN